MSPLWTNSEFEQIERFRRRLTWRGKTIKGVEFGAHALKVRVAASEYFWGETDLIYVGREDPEAARWFRECVRFCDAGDAASEPEDDTCVDSVVGRLTDQDQSGTLAKLVNGVRAEDEGWIGVEQGEIRFSYQRFGGRVLVVGKIIETAEGWVRK